MPLGPRVRLHMNRTRRGCIASWNTACDIASSDMVVIMDGHTRISAYNLNRLAQVAMERNSICIAMSQGFSLRSMMLGCGGEWCEVDDGHLFKIKWAQQPTAETDADILVPRAALVGGCYAMPREYFLRTGGILANGGHWGSVCETLSLKAWFTDTPIYVHKDIAIRHRYGGAGRKFTVAFAEVWKSRLAMLRVIFSDETWKQFLQPRMEAKIEATKLSGFVNSPELLAEAAAFQPLKLHADEEFFTAHLPGLWQRWNSGEPEPPVSALDYAAIYAEVFGRRHEYGLCPSTSAHVFKQMGAPESVAGKRVLDVGCGKGALLNMLKEGGGAADLRGFDVGNFVIYPGHTVDTGQTAAAMPYPDRGFEVVICSHVLEHLAPSDVDGVVAECARVAAERLVFSLGFQRAENHNTIRSWAAWRQCFERVLGPAWRITVDQHTGNSPLNAMAFERKA